MMETSALLRLAGHVIASLVAGGLVLVAYRWIRRRSAVLGAIVATAILVRAALGLILFWSSYLTLPLLDSLQTAGGFWQIALDAEGYYQYATAAAEIGRFYPFNYGVPAPFYVNTLALWMMAVGVSPASAVFLNLCLYVVFVVLIVRAFAPANDWRRDLPCIVGVTAYSFSPVMLFNASQSLKDELSGVVVVSAGLGVLLLRRLWQGSTDRRSLGLAGGLLVTVAIFGAAGMRWYHACIMWGALAVTLAFCAVHGRRIALPQYLAGSAAVLVLGWVAFWAGAGPYYYLIAPDLVQVWEVPAELLNFTKMARVGFLTSGGNSNIVVPLRDNAVAGLEQAKALQAAQHAGAVYKTRDYLLRADQRRAERAERERAEALLADQRRAERERAERERAEALLAEQRRLEAMRRAALLAAAQREAAEGIRAQRRDRGAATADTSVPEAPAAHEPQAVSKVQATAAPRLPRAPGEIAPEFRAVPTNLKEHLVTAATGVAIVFVPLSIIRAVAQVPFSGGRGLLALIDLDTVYMDVATVLVLVLLWKRRKSIGNRLPFVVFGLVLSATTALLLGYVVTNFGTLWRMRPLIEVPLWVLIVALSARVDEPRPAAVAVDVIAT
jgi:hypothetical protein